MRLILYSFIAAAALCLTVAGQEADPVMKGSAKYTMPQSAMDAEMGGQVVLAVRVDETGKVRDAKIFAGPMWPCGTKPTKAFDELGSTLEDTMKKLDFSPAMKAGKPVERTVGLTLTLKNPKFESGAVELDSAGKPKAKLVQGGVVNGKAISLPKPVYPAAARYNGESGAVTVQVMIDEKGKIISAGALSGPPGLQLAARDAACGAKFSPTLLAGSPVKVTGVLTYAFIQ
jgi:TonB family protein